MGDIVELHPHHPARSFALTGSASKSSAVTTPPLSSFNFLMVDQSGRTILRRIRLMVTRDRPMASATSSSESCLSSMNFERCAIPGLYNKRTIAVKPKCTSDVLYRYNPFVHDVYMAKKVKPSAFSPTFIKGPGPTIVHCLKGRFVLFTWQRSEVCRNSLSDQPGRSVTDRVGPFLFCPLYSPNGVPMQIIVHEAHIRA